MLELAGFLLTAIGAIGGVLWLRRKVGRYLNRRRASRRYKSPPRDYSYKVLRISAKIDCAGTAWETMREATIVSLQDDLPFVDLGARPLNKSDGTVSLSPDTLKLEGNGLTGGYERYRIKREGPLKAGEELFFVFKYGFRKEPAGISGEDWLSWCSSRDVEDLYLRVLFLDGKPSYVAAQVLDVSSRVLEEREVSPDPLTEEFRWHIPSPVRNLTYMLAWEVQKEDRVDNE